MPRHALNERSELADSLLGAGANQPTLCGEWTTSQLAAHLVLRERAFTEVLGRVPIARAQAVAQRALDRYVAAHSYEQIVVSFADGPPKYTPFTFPPLREAVNLLEYTIHDEDVRRAAPGWTARAVPLDRQQAIWKSLRLPARLTMRSLPFPVRLEWPSHGTLTIGRGEARVTATGDPVELALLAFGRQQVAQVDYRGTAEDIAVVREADISL